MAQVWVSVAPILIGGVFRAHNVGEIVPDSNVAAHGWDTAGLVRRVTVPSGTAPAPAIPRPLASSTISQVEYLTNAQYAALAAPDPTTLYITH